jgi:hypothetical protein
MVYPMFAMVLLTFIVGLIALKTRFAAVKAKDLKPAYFRLMETKDIEKLPERVTVTTRSFNNMFEVPILFYAGCLAVLALNLETMLTITTAWAFVLSRCWHAWIHLTYNNVIHRMKVFLLGPIFILTLWIELIVLSM